MAAARAEGFIATAKRSGVALISLGGTFKELAAAGGTRWTRECTR